MYTKGKFNWNTPIQQAKVTQFAKVSAGFDPDMQFGGPADCLEIKGLANCIAVVTYDSHKCGAVLRHYDTVNAGYTQKRDEISDDNYLDFGIANMATLKTTLDTKLRDKLYHPDIKYCVGLGALWRNVDPNRSWWMSRYSLIKAILAVFNAEPETAGLRITYDIPSNTMRGYSS